jgi:hypothetical protein
MKTTLLTLLAILVAGCHFDTLLQGSNGGATQLAFTTQPSNGTAGAPLSTVRVAAEDAVGRVVSSFDGDITVSLQANAGGATLSATVPAVNGVASFSGLEVDKAAQGYALVTASGSGLSDDTSSSFDVVPGTASKLVFTVQPGNTAPGAAITPPVKVTAFDAFDNLAANFNGNISVDLEHDGSLTRNSSLSGTKQVPAVGGVATFSDLSIADVSVTYYTLKSAFGTGAPTLAVSDPFTVTP